MQGFYNITEKIRVQLAQDAFVNTITYGDIFRVDLKKQTIFPLSHVVVNNATMEGNVFRYNISVMAMDIVDISKDAIDNTALGQFRGNDNEQDVLNTQFAVIARLLKVLESGDLFTELYQLDGNPNIEPFTERFENYLAGWVASFDVLIPNDMTSCDAATIPTSVCEDVNVFVGEALAASYPSGSDVFVTVTQDGFEVAPDNIIVTGSNVDIVLADTVPCANTTLEVNGTIEGTVASGSTVDIQLSDSGGVVTPTSVTQVGNDFQVVLPDASVPTTRSTATLMKTGQTTSYRTGDDGDIEAGRETSFLVLDTAPTHNNGSATLNTTTNRFTDELGGQTYTNNIVLDWSTWNGSTILGYYRLINGADVTWNTAIDSALAFTIGSFTIGWRLPNKGEIENIFDYELSFGLSYAPFSMPNNSIWTSTTYKASTTLAYVHAGSWINLTGKSGANGRWISCRTFSLSTSNVLS